MRNNCFKVCTMALEIIQKTVSVEIVYSTEASGTAKQSAIKLQDLLSSILFINCKFNYIISYIIIIFINQPVAGLGL